MSYSPDAVREPELVCLAPRPIVVDQDGYELVVRTSKPNSATNIHRPDPAALPTPKPICPGASRSPDGTTWVWGRRKNIQITWEDCDWAGCFGEKTLSDTQARTYGTKLATSLRQDSNLSPDEKLEKLRNGGYEEGES